MLLTAENRKRVLSIPGMRIITNVYVNLMNTLFYKKVCRKYKFNEILLNLKGKANKKRCFIVGSGPSLTIEQLNMIKDEDSFGANRIYKIFPKTLWRPKYYVIQDPYDPTPKENYERLDVENLLVSDYYWKEHGMHNKHAICYHTIRTLKQRKELPFSENIDKYVQVAGTVTYTMIQLAAYLGYKEIYLIGMDHNYDKITNDKGEVIKKSNIKNHVFEDEKPKEVSANISYMEDAYRSAKKYCDEHNIKIYNATLGGKLEVFERKNFYEIFKEEEK